MSCLPDFPSSPPEAAPPAGILPLPGRRRRILLAGKGGVGKTTLAAALAVWAADAGWDTLLVTTDPAAHLGAVLEVPVDDAPHPVAGVGGLAAVRVDAAAATAAYRRGVLADAARHFPPAALERLAEELESPCTQEVAVFHRFLDHLLQPAGRVVVFDTAPTGHTLRLLELPREYAAQLAAQAHPPALPAGQEAAAAGRIRRSLEVLRDPDRTSLAFVLYPEATPVAEAQRAAVQLAGSGIATALVVANQVLPAAMCTGPFFARRRRLQEEHLRRLPALFPLVPLRRVALRAADVRGLTDLREVARELFGSAAS